MANKVIVPAQGFQGLAQQSVATQAIWNKRGARAGTSKRTAAKKKRVAKRAPAKRKPAKKRAAKKRATGRAHLVKGSAAAKRHMARLRKMRKR